MPQELEEWFLVCPGPPSKLKWYVLILCGTQQIGKTNVFFLIYIYDYTIKHLLEVDVSKEEEKHE